MKTTIQVLSQSRRTAPFHVKTKTIMIGSLTSNQVVLEGAGVEPIHAMLEPLEGEEGTWRLTDLGTLTGVKVNGTKVVIEATVKAGDVVEAGAAKFSVTERKEAARRPVPTLFGTRAHHAQPREGRTLEVVAYWGNTVLNVDHFAPDLKGFEEVTIGDPTKAHFISGGKELFDSRVLAEVEEQSCTLKLEDGMEARVRKNGEMQRVGGVRRLQLGPRDYAHVRHGAVMYFLHYANHPHVELPVDKRQDKVLQALGALGLVGYFVLVMIALLVKPKPSAPTPPGYLPPTEIWDKRPEVTLIDLTPQKPVEIKKPDEVKPVKPTQQKKKKIVKEIPPPEKPPVVPPPKNPEKIAKQNVEAVKPPTFQATPQKTAAVTPEKPADALKPTPVPSFKPGGSGGKPAGQVMPTNLLGSNSGPGSKQTNMGQLQGQTAFNKPGVEGATGPQASTLNLGKLGNQFGKVSDKLGGTHVDFNSSAGGAGAKLGSATKDLGPGGASGKSMDYAGNGNLNGWGKGKDGGMLAMGGNGPGGPFGNGKDKGQGPGKGDGIGPGFGGHRQAIVLAEQPPSFIGEPSIALDEILRVIRSNLNQIRHCYEQGLQRKPNLQGRMKVQFTIGSNGRVQSVNVADTNMDDVLMRACVTGKIQRWIFPTLPAKAKPVQVGYPFLFNPL